MLDASKIQMPKFETCMEVGCKYHRKESRYIVRYFEKQRVVVIKCLECKPNLEICRFVVEQGAN